MSVLACIDASFGYNATPVVSHTTFTINKGELVGLVGPSGAGKSTLLKLLLGLEKPQAGSIHVHAQHSVGYAPQVSSVDWFFPVTASQVVAMGLRSSAQTPWLTASEKTSVSSIMEELSIRDISHHHIRDLSGGQQQRIFLARALVSHPDVLILDEPTSNVDIKTRDTILHLLHTLQKKGLTILMTMHDLNSAAEHLPRVICFNKTIIADGPPKRIFTKKNLDTTYEADLLVIQHKQMLIITDQPHPKNKQI